MSDRAKAYREAGVDIEAGDALVERIKPLAASTFSKGVLSGIGGFGGLFKLDKLDMEDPVLVSSTDGVGTKLKLAFEFDRHDTVGIDLVAMSVNDIIVQGAKPLFFLDYFATGKLDVDRAEAVVRGVADGCKQSGCALLGGETAEMADFYAPGEYDLAGFCVGVVDNSKIVDGSSIGVGDLIIGVASSGPHSNGYSLIRKLLAASGLKGSDPFPGEPGRTVADVLLAPTRIYAKTVQNLLRDFDIKGMVHITGGGFYGNIPRILPKGVAAHISLSCWERSGVWDWLRHEGRLSWPEMLAIFNCGLGYVLVVDAEAGEDVLQRLAGLHEKAYLIGEIKKRESMGTEQVFIDCGADQAF